MKRLIVSATIVCASSCFAGNTCTWSGAAGDGNWNTPGNWEDDIYPVSGNGDTVILSSAQATAITNNMGAISLYSLQFASGTAPIVLRGDAITLTSTDGGAGYGDAYGKVSALYAAAVNVTNVIENDIVLPSGSHLFTVASRAGLEVAGAISGAGGLQRRSTENAGYSKGSVLILSGDNSFEGGVTLRNDINVFATTNALGKPGTKSVYFFNAGATYRFAAVGDYNYNIQFKEGPLTLQFQADCRIIKPLEENNSSTKTECTIYLDAGVNRVDFMSAFGRGATTSAIDKHEFTFDCPAGSAVYFHGVAALGKVKFGNDVAGRKGFDVHFLASGTSYAGPIDARFANIHMYEEDFLHPDESPVLNYPRQADMGCYHLHGFDQTINRLTTESLSANFIADNGRWFITDTPATLTIKATSSGSANCAFQGPLTLVYDAQGDYTQCITGRTCSISGDLIVSNGTFALTGSTTMKNLKSIRVANGGTFALNVTSSAALTGVKSVNVESGGTFRYVSGTNPFPAGKGLELDDGAYVDLPAAVSLAFPISTNGALVANGTYQPEDGADASAVKVPWLASGSAVLTVALDAAYWRAAVSGSWSDPANWTSVPDPAGNVNVSANGADYTVNVASDAGTYGNLAIHRLDEGTTTLSVTAPFGTGQIVSGSPRSGYLTLGKGAKVSVGDGGVWQVRSTDAYSTTEFYKLTDGAEFRIDGGTFFASNFCGHAVIGDASGDVSVTSKVVLAGGSLDFFIRESNSSYFTIQRNGALEISSGRARFYANRGSDYPIRSEKGGGIAVSGSGRLELGGKDSSNVPLSGDMRFSGNGQLSGILGKGSVNIRMSPHGDGEECVMEFKDHAGIDPTGFATYNGIEGAYMFGWWYVNDSIDGSTRLLLHSDATYQFGSAVLLGVQRGRAELELTGGRMIIYYYGLKIGTCCQYNIAQTTVPNVESVFRMSGGSAYIRGGGAYLYPTYLYGLVAGDGSNVAEGYEGLVKGRIELSGGALTNVTANSFTAFGIGRGYGEMIQTGGSFVREDNSFIILGMRGGEGRYVMSNGTAKVTGTTGIWVGGVATNTLNRTLPNCPENHAAKGLLGVYGGSFTAPNSTICLGADGTGLLEIGETGSLSAKSLVVSNGVAEVAKSGVSLKFGPTGIGRVSLSGALTLEPGAKLTVDLTEYTGRKNRFKVMSYASHNGTFANADITVEGDSRLVGITAVEQSDTGIDIRLMRGMAISFR